jgi:hypothetical protein
MSTTTAPALATEAAQSPNYPANRFDPRERRLLQSVLEYLNAGLSSAQLAAGSVTLAKLAPGVTPSHVVKFAGTYTTLGGAATEAQTLTGVAATDIVVATLKAKGATPRTILTTAGTLNTITYVFSGDPSTDHTVTYVVWRAAS